LPVTRPQAVGVRPESRYVPATGRARTELGLQQTIGLADAIERTVRWYAPREAERSAQASVFADAAAIQEE
jgi:hypothetical protein